MVVPIATKSGDPAGRYVNCSPMLQLPAIVGSRSAVWIGTEKPANYLFQRRAA
jgi:hypothetical protein